MAKQFQSGDCAPGEVIALLALGRDAAGLMPESEAEAWMGHVAGCESCAGLLREAVLAGEGPLTSSEQVKAAKLVAPISNPAAHSPKRPQSLLWTIASAAAVAIVALVAVIAFRTRQMEDVPKLLAQTYTETRPFEWRLPDAGYSPVRVQRSGRDSSSIDLESLRVVMTRESGSRDRKLQAWFGLLYSQDPEPAISALTEIVTARPDDAEAANLLGVALARRAELAPSPEAFDAAIRIWNQALSLMPANSALLRYNVALALSRSNRRGQASAILEALLKETPASDPWRGELTRQIERWRGTNGAR